jgi:CubicO group peptidase (beta-lactamase class C family)/predicted esterase
MPSASIRAFVEAVDQQVDTMHSFLLVRHGHVIAEGWWAPQSPTTPHVLYSLSKSFTSTAVGMAIAEGKLSIDDPVLEFFPDEAPTDPSEKLKNMRIRDLLTMTCGHQTEPRMTADVPWKRTFLAHPVEHKPGTHFHYNSPGTYMCSAIIQNVTGQTLLDYLKPRLFEPLGIDQPTWSQSPEGINHGGWGLSLCTEDIAKFGQLYLQNGQWQGRQLVPAAWIAQATAKQVANGSDPTQDWDQGYGFQFWRCRHDAYRADGANGQYCIVMPQQDAVIAITGDTRDMKKPLNLVWDLLLPAMLPAAQPENAAETSRLQTTLAQLKVSAQHEPIVMKVPAATVSRPEPILLWPTGAPGSEGKTEPEKVETSASGERKITSIHQPSITPFLAAKEKANGAAVLVIPGGGHRMLCIDHEGDNLARWLGERGVAAFVLRHRLAREEGSTYTIAEHAFADTQRAMRLIRSRAAEWGVDPARLGAIGFSAGGELVAQIAMKPGAGMLTSADAIEREPARPAFQGLIYPGRSGDIQPDHEAAPAFLACGENDRTDIAEGLADVYLRFKRAKASAEFHVFAGVGHGFGFRADMTGPVAGWPQRFLEWLDTRGILHPTQATPRAK